ncbi:MAG: preprotein translocase subunit YajC [Alkalispirochaetaceae bacterium]
MERIIGNLLPLMGAPEGAAGGSPQSVLPTFVTFGLVFLIFYFLIIRPQNKKQKETKEMLSALQKGDRVATIGGIRGTIHALKDESVVLKVDDNTKLEFSRSAVANVLEKKGASAKKTKQAQVEEEPSEESEDEENA